MGEHTPDGLKRCRKCGELKPLAEFPPHSTGADGHRNQCGDCYRVIQRQRRAVRRDEINAKNRQPKNCVACGREFRSGALRCGACLAKERQCGVCGKTFRGTMSRCRPCQARRISCAQCGREFVSSGGNLSCQACCARTRECTECGRTFSGQTLRCGRCQAKERDCTGCGKRFTGTTRRCAACQAKERDCVNCGRRFRGTQSRCWPCVTTDRICAGCGLPFRGHQLFCTACVARDRNCTECGRRFRSTSRVCGTCRWLSLPLEERQEYARKIHARRKQLLADAEVEGPVPWSVYQAVMKSGPCSYCGDEAKTVDHIRPLTRGGIEHESNLTPACKFCNNSKGARLLTEWHTDRVIHGISSCPKVAAEWERQYREAA